MLSNANLLPLSVRLPFFAAIPLSKPLLSSFALNNGHVWVLAPSTVNVAVARSFLCDYMPHNNLIRHDHYACTALVSTEPVLVGCLIVLGFASLHIQGILC